MARLIVLNGAPASGKSTLARRWAAEHQMALALDIDVIRAMLGASLDDPIRSGLAARRLAVEMARRHLVDGHDVIIPQFLGREEFLGELADLAREVGVEFIEVVLIASMSDLRRRFDDRSQAAEQPEHRDAALLVEQSRSDDPLAAMHAALQAVIDRRTWAHRVDVVHDDVEGTFRRLCIAVG